MSLDSKIAAAGLINSFEKNLVKTIYNLKEPKTLDFSAPPDPVRPPGVEDTEWNSILSDHNASVKKAKKAHNDKNKEIIEEAEDFAVELGSAIKDFMKEYLEAKASLQVVVPIGVVTQGASTASAPNAAPISIPGNPLLPPPLKGGITMLP